MASHAQVCDRWVDVVLGRTTKKLLAGSRVFASGDQIFSYGRHFPMANVVRDKRGQVTLFLVNGDRFSVSTNRHQSDLRSALSGVDVPQVIIPFSALRASGVDPDTIELIDRSDDRTITTEHRAYTPPEGSEWRRVPIREYQRRPDAEIQAMLDAKNAERMGEWEAKHRWARDEHAPGKGWALQPNIWKLWVERDSVAEYPYEATEDDLYHHQMHHDVVTGYETHLYRGRNQWSQQITVTTDDDGRTVYEWETRKHLLGESLVRGKIRWMQFIRCKDCQGRGVKAGAPPRPESPNHWDDAFVSNRTAWREAYDTWAEEDHQWSQEWLCPNGRGRTEERSRTTYFVSGFDHNEPRPLYFFCELPPRVRPTTLEQAYEMLKPETVRIAEQMGREVKRQGDIFAIPLERLTKRELRKQGATFEKRGELLGTNHVATEVARMPDGTTLSRGTLVHAPRLRQPDHVRCPLGKNWHVVLKNTVPVAA